MLARIDGQVVLVTGAIPGERVTAIVERVGRDVAYADTVAVDHGSADRRDLTADPLCGGCLYAHIAYARQLDIKAAVIEDAFARIARLVLPSRVRLAPSSEDGYRMRARLHVRGHRIGFFREGTHEICDARQTRQLLPATLDVLDRLSAGLGNGGLEAVREIELAENIDASDRVVQLDAATTIDNRLLEQLAGTEALTGVVSRSSTQGSPFVTDRIAIGDELLIVVRRHVAAFFQGNRYLLSSLVGHVVEQVPDGSEVVDLYAGGGLFALGAAVARHAKVTSVEGDRVAAADLEANAAAIGGAVIPVRQAVEAFVAASMIRPDCVILDPPRAGVSREAIDGVIRLHARRIVYVSCDVATLARDSRRLVDSGYAIARVDGFDLFPNTAHVETVVVFEM